MKPIALSIFFPAHNEEANIVETVEEAVRVVSESPFIADAEIIVVDDGSKDRTAALVEELIERHPMVRLVRHIKNKGYGASLRTGIQTATKEYVFFTDADLQFDIRELHSLLVHVPDYEVVLGYRAPRRDPVMRLVNAWGWKVLNRVLFGLKVADIDCAFKLFKRSTLQSVKLVSTGAMLSAELLIRLSRRGVSMKQVPVSHLPRTRGSASGANLSVILRAFSEMVKLYRGDLGLVTQKELLRFASVGVVNTILDIAAYYLLTRYTPYFGAHLNAAKFASFFLGTVSSLVLNRSWTFGLRTRPSVAEIFRFYATASLAMLINVGVMTVLLRMGMYDLVAVLVTTVVTFAASFTLSKFWVFKSRDTQQAPGLVYQ